MFESLSDRINGAFRKISGRGRITESNVRDAMSDVRTALLEADVHVDVVQSFCDEVLAQASGVEVTKSLKPGQEMIGIVHQHLVNLMGPVDSHLLLVDPPPTIIMLCGLQGSGKTTTCGKLAAYLKKRGKSVLVTAADLQRPAAVEQLGVVTKDVAEHAPGQASIQFYAEPDKCDEYGKAVGVAVDVCRRAVAQAVRDKIDVVILDTAGRLHVNDDLMNELGSIQRTVKPHQILLIVDAMAGQDAVNSARSFNERLAIDGVILTKFDSDTRGGAALSVKQVTGAPIKFIGVGEKSDALEEFHPERMAGRILGMGDVVSLVEKAQEEVDEQEAEALAAKMAKGRLTMDDFLKQIRSIRRMGPMKQLLGMLPGVGSALKNIQVDDDQLNRIEGIVHSMTKPEREDIKTLNKSRIKRISRGSGTSIGEVNKLTKQFDMIQNMTKQMSGMGAGARAKAMKDLSQTDAGMMPGLPGMPGMGGRGSTKTSSRKRGFKQRKKRR